MVEHEDSLVAPVLQLLAGVWFAAPLLWLFGAAHSWTTDATGWLLGALACALLAPLAGLLLASWAGRRRAATGFAAAFVVGLVAAVATGALAIQLGAY